MTKSILVIFIFFSLNIIHGQNDLNGEWIGKNLKYLSVNDSLFSIEFRNFLEDFQYMKTKEQVVLKKVYEVFTRTKDYKSDSTLYYFNYKIIDNDYLVLKLDKIVGLPLSNPKDEYNFKRKSTLKKSKINFQSVFFESSTCMGECPKMKIGIDSLGNVRFKGEKHTKPYIGNYKGRLTRKQLDKFIDILNRSELDQFPKRLPFMLDSSNYKFIFKYDNKVKKSNGSAVPYFNQKVVKYLLNIYKEIEWTKINNEIKFNE